MFRLIIIFFSVLTLMTAVMADLSPDAVKRCKDATAIVEFGPTFNTAFCIDKSGYFVTSSRWVTINKLNSVKIILYPGTPEQYITKARVLRTDDNLSLTTLKVDEDKVFTALEWGNPSKLVELADVSILGNTAKSPIINNVYSPITLSISHVTSLKKTDDILQQFKLSPILNPGFCGGPVVDENGLVIGIMANGSYGDYSTSNGTGTDTAITPLSMRKSFDIPEFAISFPQISVENQQNIVDFSVNSLIAYPSEKTYSITLALNAGTSAERKFPLTKVADNLYQAKIIPVPQLDKQAFLELKIQSDNNFFTCHIPNGSISVNGLNIPLDTVSTIENNNPTLFKMRDGKEVKGKVIGLDKIEVTIGDIKTMMNLSNASSIELIDAGTQIDSVNYKVTASLDNIVLSEINGIIPICSQSVSNFINNQKSGIITPVMNNPTSTVSLPGVVSEVTEGGCGRYLILSFKKLRKIAIFDVNKLKITNEILMPSDNFKVAASIDKILVLFPDLSLLLRYNLNTCKLEMSASIPDNEMKYRSISVGCCSAGPVLINGYIYGSGKSMNKFMDLNTLKFISLKSNNNLESDISSMSMSENGMAFTIGNNFIGKWNGNDIEKLRDSYNYPSYPDFNGTLFFGSEKGIFGSLPQYSKIRDFSNLFCISTVGGIYFIEVKEKSLIFYLTSSLRKLLTIPELDDISIPKDREKPLLPLRQQIHYISDANLLLYLNRDGDKLMLRKLVMEDALVADGIDFLYIASNPKTSFKPGTTYHYQIKVKSGKGNVSYSLNNPLPGMALSDAGLLEWQVPKDYPNKSEDILISITDDSKQTCFHNFKITAE